jgi:multidrug efflux pump subunit AcrB
MILLLFTTILSAFIYQRTRQDIHLMLSIFTAIIFVVWGLAIAHWSIHIFALLALLCIRIPEFRAKTVEAYNSK